MFKPESTYQKTITMITEICCNCGVAFRMPSDLRESFLKLIPSNIVEGRDHKIWKLPPSKDRAKLRSKTFPGISAAMAEQWGNYLLNKLNK